MQWDQWLQRQIARRWELRRKMSARLVVGRQPEREIPTVQALRVSIQAAAVRGRSELVITPTAV